MLIMQTSFLDRINELNESLTEMKAAYSADSERLAKTKPNNSPITKNLINKLVKSVSALEQKIKQAELKVKLYREYI